MTIYTPRTAQKQVQKPFQNRQKRRSSTTKKEEEEETADSRTNSTTKNHHAGGNCGKKHAKIDDFSSKFEH